MNTPPRAGFGSRPAHPRYLGRYELRQALGRGAQATVWLAHDPRLDRQVAIKVLPAVRPGERAGMEPWLREARHVARLAHPHIATLFEADVIDGLPSLVFEYVPGQTLAGHLKAFGAMPASDAVTLLLPVLDALQVAHAAGLVHRDLKPSNILLDHDLRPKVTDFGIAAPVGSADGDAVTVQGTPGYLSPEAATGKPATATSDVFSAALVLAEMLFGRPLVDGRDAFRAIYRATHEDLALPQDGPHDVDDALRTLLMRALARDARQRIASADAFAQALRDWQQQPQDSGPDRQAQGGHATLGFLLRRMRRKTDFPAMSESIGRVQSMASSENESLNSLTSEILKDVALTNKLLRMVNTAQFAHAGGGSINTVSRAVGLIGFVGIRNIAMSLVLLEHMQNKAHANLLKAEFLRALLAASLASDLCALSREGEEVFIGSLFQNLGRMLTEFYFPEEAQQMRLGMAAGKSEDAAALAVLGMSCEDLGLGVARVWDLPASIQRLMRKPAGQPPTRVPADSEERLRWLCLASNEMADAFLHKEGQALARELARLSNRHAAGIGLDSRHIQTVALAAREKLAQTAEAMGVLVAPDSPAARLLKPAALKEIPTDPLQPLELTAEAPEAEHTAQVTALPRAVSVDLLATGIQDITNAMVEDFELNDVLRMVLETMYRALGFRRVLFCLRDAATHSLTGRFGLGEDAASVARQFRVPLKDPNDLFGMVCNKGLDTLIRDAGVPAVAQKMPAWYRSQINAPAFLLLPLQLKGTPFGLIYADKASASDIALDEKELALLKTLRNQAVMAFRQSRP